MNTLLLGLGLALGAPGLKDPPRPPASVVGEWTIESSIHGGKPDHGLAQSPIDKVVITADEWIVYRAGQPAHRAALAFDPKPDPPHFDLNAGGKAAGSRGVYKLDGDTLTIAYTLGGVDRPTKVESPPGSEVWLMTLKRLKK